MPWCREVVCCESQTSKPCLPGWVRKTSLESHILGPAFTERRHGRPPEKRRLWHGSSERIQEVYYG